MARRLEKIEKELGYCEIKLEKEKRLRKQIELMDTDLQSLDRLIHFLSEYAPGSRQPGVPETFERPNREAFLAAGLHSLEKENRELLLREREEIQRKLEHYDGFFGKRKLLEGEKKELLGSLNGPRSARLRQINEEFKKVEKLWNELTEDLINFDDGIFFLGRNLDYLKSCRHFLIAAKGDYDLEGARPTGHLTDLFRHSNIGRAVEMADGADRNLQSAQKSLICAASLKLKPENYLRVLGPFMEALYEDLYVEGRLERSIQAIEAALAGNLKLLEDVRRRREAYAARLGETEKARTQVFNRLGKGRRRELAT